MTWFENYFRYIGWPAINESTIHQGLHDQMLRLEYPAQCYAGRKKEGPDKFRSIWIDACLKKNLITKK